MRPAVLTLCDCRRAAPIHGGQMMSDVGYNNGTVMFGMRQSAVQCSLSTAYLYISCCAAHSVCGHLAQQHQIRCCLLQVFTPRRHRC